MHSRCGFNHIFQKRAIELCAEAIWKWFCWRLAPPNNATAVTDMTWSDRAVVLREVEGVNPSCLRKGSPKRCPEIRIPSLIQNQSPHFFGQVTNPTCCITVLRSWKMQQPQRKAAASCDTAVKGTRSSTAIKGAAKVNARPVVIESCWNKSSTEDSHEFTRPTVCVCEPESSYNIIIPYIPTSQCIHQQPDPPPWLHPILRGSVVAMTLP